MHLMMCGTFEVRYKVPGSVMCSNEVAPDDLVQLGAVWVAFVIEFCLGLGIPIIVLDVGIPVEVGVGFLKHLVKNVVGKLVIALCVGL